MSWWVKSALFLLVGLSLGITACEAPKEIGLPPGVLMGVKYTDTITVRTSTVLLDSVRTSGNLELLVGRYKDPVFGQITANTFFDVPPPAVPFVIKEGTTYEYDSAVVYMNFNYVYGDTLKPFKFNIHRLNDTLSPKTYYNYNTAAFATKPLMSVEFNPHLGTSNIVRRRLPDDFGKEIFALNGTTDGSTIAAFTKKIRGISLQTDPNNNCVLGMRYSSFAYIIYYHEKGQTTALSLSMIPSIKRFNQVQSNRVGTNLAALQAGKSLSPQATKGFNYIQEAVGITTKIEFPYLDKIIKGNVAINRAELMMSPQIDAKVGNNFIVLPDNLVLAESDDNNRVARTAKDIESLLADDGTTFNAATSPQFATYERKFNNYNFILTTYFQALTTGFKKNKGLLMMPMNYGEWYPYVSNYGLPARYSPYFNTSVNRAYFKPDKENLKLVVFYTETK